MIVPDGMTEAEVLAAVAEATNAYAESFVFGYHDSDDIRQQGSLFCLEALARYNPQCDSSGKPTRPLVNFLTRHVRNRLTNFKRDHHHRCDPPCRPCHEGREHEHPNGEVCRRYRDWARRNSAKANLARPQGIDGVPDERESSLREESTVVETADFDELTRKIDTQLDPALRTDYLRLKAGQGASIPRARRDQVREAIAEILGLNADL